jgi:uncharacterized protein
VIYLLDVNALLALGLAEHEFNGRVVSWLQAMPTSILATCSITELGFVRVLTQAPAYGFTIQDARSLLLRLKEAKSPQFTFIADANDISHLPGWVKTGRQTTDGHLQQLAVANGAILATLDEGIPDTFLIPSKPGQSVRFRPH